MKLDDSNEWIAERGDSSPRAELSPRPKRDTVGKKALVEMLPSSYDVAPGIVGADGIVRGRMSDIELYDIFAPDWRTDMVKRIRQSVARVERADRVEQLARFYADYESCEVSPFDVSEDTDILP